MTSSAKVFRCFLGNLDEFFFLIFFTPDSSLASFSLTHCTAFWMTIKREGHTSSQPPSEIIQLAMLVLNSRNFQFNKFRATIVRCKRIRMYEKRRNENTRAVVSNLSRWIFRSSPEEIFRAKVSPTCCYPALRKFPMALTPDLACANLTELCS